MSYTLPMPKPASNRTNITHQQTQLIVVKHTYSYAYYVCMCSKFIIKPLRSWPSLISRRVGEYLVWARTQVQMTYKNLIFNNTNQFENLKSNTTIGCTICICVYICMCLWKYIHA
ncbi:unnamed protein product [Ceratitis capitata]|uniref:(Mediterranean fruit fly) hypothetical protein n=1 Tax=Ceratitis capitata TaxID=7213 RepID=A0A811U1Q5_CERCA|nr:unnamed protein product [Ceratitis capitata]